MHRAAARALFSSSSSSSSSRALPQKSRRPQHSSITKGSFALKTFAGVFTTTCCSAVALSCWSSRGVKLVSMSSGVSNGGESFTEYARPPPIVVETTGGGGGGGPPRRCDKAIIFLHGLGDTGRGWSDIPNQSSLGEIENVRWVFLLSLYPTHSGENLS